MVFGGQLEQSRQYTGDSDGYESEITPYNLRIARSPTESKASRGDSGKSKNKVVNSANVRANKRVKFISNDEYEHFAKPEDFYYLIGTIHRDDEDLLTYKTMKIYVHKTTHDIVGERALVFKDGSVYRTNELDPIHVRDLAVLTELYDKEEGKALISCNLAAFSSRKSDINVNTDVFNANNLIAEENRRVQLSMGELQVLIPIRHRGDQLVDYCMEAMTNIVNVFTPSTRKQALKCEQANRWMEAERKR